MTDEPKIYADFVEHYEGYWIKKYREVIAEFLEDLKDLGIEDIVQVHHNPNEKIIEGIDAEEVYYLIKKWEAKKNESKI